MLPDDADGAHAPPRDPGDPSGSRRTGRGFVVATAIGFLFGIGGILLAFAVTSGLFYLLPMDDILTWWMDTASLGFEWLSWIMTGASALIGTFILGATGVLVAKILHRYGVWPVAACGLGVLAVGVFVILMYRDDYREVADQPDTLAMILVSMIVLYGLPAGAAFLAGYAALPRERGDA